MDGESTNDSEEILKILGNRIEEIEQILVDDEEFCNKDIDSILQAALIYIKSIGEKFQAKLKELEVKLEQIRGENLHTSKQNKKQFDDEIDEVNQLFSSGKHQEALEKFLDYEKRFQQRMTTIQNVPKLYTKDIDIDQCLSFNKPTPLISTNETKSESLKNTEQTIRKDSLKNNNNLHDQESNKSSYDIRYKRSDNPQSLTRDNSISNQSKSPTSSQRSIRFSTRLMSSPSNKSLPISERDSTTSSLVRSNHSNSRENIAQTRSTSSSPNILPSLVSRQMIPSKTGRGDGLTASRVACYRYQHERNTSLLMTCTKDCIILFGSQTDLRTRCCLSIILRSTEEERDLNWSTDLITSLGTIDKNNVYIFTESNFHTYSLNPFSEVNSWVLLNKDDTNIDPSVMKQHGIGIVYGKYLYYISMNKQHHQIFSQYQRETMQCLNNFDLTEIFPEVTRFVNICITDKIIGFLVELAGSQYACIFCPNNNRLTSESKRVIYLSYAENPLSICSIYVEYLKKCLFFINDPSAKVIHILTNEKYVKSYAIIATTLCYIEETQELIFTSIDGIHSIKLNEQEGFFSKFR